MDRMTTPGTAVVTQARRLRANWPALVLPALAAELLSMFRFHDHAPWLMLLAVSMGFVVAKPALAAKVAPFALLGYGLLGFLVAHALLTWQHTMIWYGFFMGRAANPSLMFVLPEAFLFLAASLWLLVATGGPGAGAVRRAVQELRGTAGQPRTVPALLLLPVLFLWEEAFANPLWYGAGGDANGVPMAGVAAWQVAGLALAAGGVYLMRRRQRAAAVVAVLGLIILGLIFMISAFGGWEEFLAYAQGKIPGEGQAGFYPAAPGVFSGLYGPVLLENQSALWLIRAEGVALLAAGSLLAPRMVGWAADAQLVRRAAALTQRVDRLDQTRSDATSTAVAELRRIERDLHDGAQARLVAVGMSLRAAEQLMPTSPEAALALIGEARETSSRALADLRDLVRGIYPPVLADRGLADAVRTLALDTPLTVQTDITLSGEPPMPIAAAVYFGIAEILTNAVRHSGADKVEIGIGYAGGLLRATITDDGTGGADAAKGTGLAGVERRLATFDGVLAVSSPPGGPTIIAIEVPCELADTDVARSRRFAWQEKTLLGG
jgi:signal transduction histidine kinase